MAGLKLLRDVVAFRQRFYPCGWEKYQDARWGHSRSFQVTLISPSCEETCRGMTGMIYGESRNGPPAGRLTGVPVSQLAGSRTSAAFA
jgi:hypothetical protein